MNKCKINEHIKHIISIVEGYRLKMSKTFSINVRVSRQQKEMIENNAKANGYANVSDYMRTRSLCFLVCEDRLNKIYKKLYPEEIHKIKINGANKNLLDFP